MLRTDYVFDASEGTITFTDSVTEANIEVIINAKDMVQPMVASGKGINSFVKFDA